MAATITGSKELDAKFKHLSDKGASKVAVRAIRAGMRLIVRGIKSEIPSHMKGAKQAIRSRFKKNTRKKDGIISAKVGAAVGMSKAKQAASSEKAKAAHGRGKKPGVGIGARNIHWALIGTKSRTQKTTGRKTGIMPAVGAVKLGFAKSEAAAVQKIKDTLAKGIAREFKK